MCYVHVYACIIVFQVEHCINDGEGEFLAVSTEDNHAYSIHTTSQFSCYYMYIYMYICTCMYARAGAGLIPTPPHSESQTAGTELLCTVRSNGHVLVCPCMLNVHVVYMYMYMLYIHVCIHVVYMLYIHVCIHVVYMLYIYVRLAEC